MFTFRGGYVPQSVEWSFKIYLNVSTNTVDATVINGDAPLFDFYSDLNTLK